MPGHVKKTRCLIGESLYFLTRLLVVLEYVGYCTLPDAAANPSSQRTAQPNPAKQGVESLLLGIYGALAENRLREATAKADQLVAA